MHSIIQSQQKAVTIGPEQPFVVIGERINPTGRQVLSAQLAAGRFDRLLQDAAEQLSAGAHLLDINVGVPGVDEPALLAEAVRGVQAAVDVPLVLDSANPQALIAALEAYQGKALVNSVTGEEERLETLLPAIKKHGAAVIGIANDETGIAETPDERFQVARKIVERAADHGIPSADVLIDPVVLPIGARPRAALDVLYLVRRCHTELKVNTCCGISNISYGLPDRPTLNAAFLSMVIAAGMPTAILNPLEDPTRRAIMAANLLMGHDEKSTVWVNFKRAAANQQPLLAGSEQ